MSRRQTFSKLQVPPSANAGLWMNKFARVLDRNQPEAFNTIFDETVNLKGGPEFYKIRFDAWKKALEKAGALLGVADASKTRLAVGLGNEGVLETSINLSHTYGLPVIPGSALKGVAAAFAHRELEGWEKGGAAHSQLFGFSNEQAQGSGSVTFHDAWPEPGSGSLSQDVINVHHPEYYQAQPESVEKPPADWDDPVPIAFLTASGKYLVAVSGDDPAWCQTALEILKMALKEYGVGAKTTRGYGRMKLSIDKPASASGSGGGGLEDLIAPLRKLTAKDKPSFNQVHAEKWKKPVNEQFKREFGKAILESLHRLGWYKDWKDKPWLKEIEAFCDGAP